jgi:Kef-type K+ transport system membrane component KefB
MPKLHSVIFPSDPVQQGMLQTVAWLGLLFFLLETGLKMDFSSAWRHRGNALKIALTDIMVPMCLGFMTSFFIPDQYLVNPAQRVIFSLFMATVMTISAMPITARALADLNVAKTDLGFLIMSALSVNEILGWIIFTIVIGTFIHIAPDVQGLVLIFSGTLAFTVICLTLGRKFANRVITITKNHGFPEPGTSLTFICLMGFLCGAIFQKLGVHALLGFFVAGVMVGEARELPEETRQVISQMVYALFIPLFFTGIGLGIDFLSNFNLFLALFVTVVGVAGKFLGAWIGLRFTNVSKVDRLSVAIAHTPGGSMEIVIGMLALQYNLISKSMFVAIVFGAVLSAVILGPWLRYSLGRRKHVSILELFSKRQLVADIKADSKESALYELCAIACSHHNMPDPDVIYHAVMDRESL